MTRAAQAFGKRLQDFTGNRETKAYLAALGATDANQRVFIQAVQGLLKTRHEGNLVVSVVADHPENGFKRKEVSWSRRRVWPPHQTANRPSSQRAKNTASLGWAQAPPIRLPEPSGT